MNLDDEIRCGYKVTHEMKTLWRKQIDLYLKLSSVCDKYNLKLFAEGGTLLGAVRHKGYIPWDDDMDFFMLREDYERLKEVAPTEFTGDYFFQTTYTDNIIRNHAQIRDINTTCLIKDDYNKKHCKGIFIDIFILDKIPLDKEKQDDFISMATKKWYRTIPPRKKDKNRHSPILVLGYNSFFYFIDKLMYKLIVLFSGGRKKYFNKFELFCQKYKDEKEYLLTDIMFSQVNDLKNVFNKDYFNKVINLPFEDIEMKCPKEYDDVLKIEFGNYMEFKIGTSCHGNIFFDCDNSYKKYENLKKQDFINLFK